VGGGGGGRSPALLYLAAAGVGTLGVIDDDRVELSNLQRQIVHGVAGLGGSKVESARATIAAINPEIRVEIHDRRLTADNIAELIARYDLVADGSDNFTTRYLLNDACFAAGKTLVSASLFRFDGQLSTFKAHLGAPHPCYRCLFPEPPPPDLIPRCDAAGILGATAGVLGTLQATEVLKELLGLGDTLSGTLLMYDGLATGFHKIRVPKDPACRLCGAKT
jgi:adenylyltransferase/sulfurtransferase